MMTSLSLELQGLIKSFRNLTEDSPKKVKLFKQIIRDFYITNRREFAWRKNISSYKIFISEIMLQQTQVERVAQKFENFISEFPDFEALANAPFCEVLRLWKGLGYNRRALALQKTAQLIVNEHNNILPNKAEILETFPGIGKATARSILSFAFNLPTVFIETNIRTVYIYFFFENANNIHDKQILNLVEETLDISNPREWYYALMDYGVWLKKNVGNLNRLSSHYAKQSKFEGSDRQIRGQILQILLEQGQIKKTNAYLINKDESRVEKIIKDLCLEGYIEYRDEILCLKS
jgi:A/G-specific adenine glycosylase